MTCYLCHGDDLEQVADKFRYDVPKIAYRCRACSLVFMHPRMTAEEERRFYELEYGIIYSQEKNVTPRDLFQARQSEARLYVDWTAPFVQPGGRALEIGSASGYFLDMIRSGVASVAGVETHTELRDYARELGITMYADLAEVPLESADAVFIFFVLEHVGDPLAFLAAVTRVCRPGARLFIVVPNVVDRELRSGAFRGCNHAVRCFERRRDGFLAEDARHTALDSCNGDLGMRRAVGHDGHEIQLPGHIVEERPIIRVDAVFRKTGHVLDHSIGLPLANGHHVAR